MIRVRCPWCASEALGEPPTFDQLQDLQRDVTELVRRFERRTMALWAIIDTFEAAVRAQEARCAGGQHVPYHGDFASVGPSTIGQMRRWTRDLRAALKDQWPMTREEYAAAWPQTDRAELDRMFAPREP